MKRLFAIRDLRTDKMARSLGFFGDKTYAKAERDKLNERSKNRYRVMLGPDHWNYTGVSNNDEQR